MQAVARDAAFQLQLIVTGTHLVPAFGHTIDAIKADGYRVDAEVPCVLDNDDPVSIAQSMSLALSGCAAALARLQPDLVMVLGDRYEIFAAVQAALVARIPVGHIAGGDVTEGAYDDSFRHGITKMSHLHFVTNAQAAERVAQLGETPAHIFVTGSPSIDLMLALPRYSRAEIEHMLGFRFRQRNLLVCFHSETLGGDTEAQCRELLAALAQLPDYGIVFTKSNADEGGRAINQLFDAYAASCEHAMVRDNLGQQMFYSVLGEVDLILGNSSSGLYEAPSFGTPAVNVGIRQQGRPQADSTFNCTIERDAILASIAAAFAYGRKATINPYGDGQSAARIIAAIKSIPDLRALLRKRFHTHMGLAA
jgi:UDP-N-acetylglucosamine 2-epimerase (non-hydrolysing)/GDP/UDP-N,N'-diacetylbacillosamine 2-epimerase (hydrolysing)